MITRRFVAAALACGMLFSGAAVSAQERLRVGMLTTLSGVSADLGRDVADGFQLAIRHAGGRLGGLQVDITEADDQLRPEVGLQAAERLIERNRVHLVTGIIFSNVFQAVHKTVLDGNAFLVTPQAHLATLAGKDCHPNFVLLGTQSDNYAESTGMLAKQAGYRRVYVITANYLAGRQAAVGFKKHYDLPLAGESSPTLGQTDFAAEIAQIRAANPDALYAFLPGGMGMAFLRQYAQSGLMARVPHLGGWASYDPPSLLAAVGDAAIGAQGTSDWSADMDNPTNRRFVTDFTAAFGRVPSHYAAASYDAGRLIDAAIRQVGGRLNDRAALSRALRTVPFESVRGPNFKINFNGFPIADHFKITIERGADGRPVMRTGERVVQGLQDPYHAECGLPRS